MMLQHGSQSATPTQGGSLCKETPGILVAKLGGEELLLFEIASPACYIVSNQKLPSASQKGILQLRNQVEHKPTAVKCHAVHASWYHLLVCWLLIPCHE